MTAEEEIKKRLQASLNQLPGAWSLPDDIGFSQLGDGSSLITFELESSKTLAIEGRTMGSLKALSCLVTVETDLISGELDATLQLGPADSDVELQLGGVFTDRVNHSLPTPVPDWSLVLTAAAVHGLPLGKLLAELIPGLADDLSKFKVNDLRIELKWEPGPGVIDQQGGKAENATVFQMLATGRLGGDGEWTVIPGLLSLSGPRLAVGIQGGRPFLELYEKLDLFGLRWAVNLQLPAGAGSAELLTQDGVTMRSFVEHFGLHDPSNTLKSISVASAAVRFDAHNHLFGVSLELDPDSAKGKWCLGPEWLALTDVAFELVYTPAGVAARASARLSVAGALFRLSLEHAGPGMGWQVAASCDLPKGRLTLDALLKAIDPGFTSPTVLSEFTLDGVCFTYDTLTHALMLRVEGNWKKSSAELTFTSSHSADGKAVWDIHGQLMIAGAILATTVDHNDQGTGIVAGYAADGNGGLSLGALLSELMGSEVHGLPDISLQSALFAEEETGKADQLPPTKLLAADLKLEIPESALHKIPVLGERLSKDASLGLNLHVIYSSVNVSDLSTITQFAPPGTPTLPTPVLAGFASTTVEVRIGSKTFPIGGVQPELPSVNGQPGTQAPVPPTPDAPSSTPTPPPVAVHQNLGGVLDIRSVRPAMNGSTITLSIDGGVHFGPVTMDVMGFSIGYDLKNHKPTVPSLHGLSLLLDKPPVRVEGGFLLIPGTKGSPPDFVGKAEITTSRFSLTALGGFAMVGGSPSLFVYGVLNMPLGGPPFFFVEGLAAGFGLNRHLTLPSIGDVETFPLVQAAIPGAPAIDLEKLHASLTPQVGSGFFAAGVKFNSFRVVHGFVLVVVGIDTVTGDYELALIGTGDWISPPEAPVGARMSYIRLDILATMSSRDTCVLVQAKLGPDCFVNNPLCHLSGGMALASWYGGEHEGDFVLTVGGYSPRFIVPNHYPVPGRLTLDYRIADGLHAGGSLYFALTPSNLMFGVELNATWSQGRVNAWFDLGLDFLMKFKPLHYEAWGHIEIGAKVNVWLGTISVSAGADIHIWGPSFGGHATVHLGPFHGSLSFGSPVAPPPALTAGEFKKAFLPEKPEDVLSIRPAGGLRTTIPAPTTIPASDSSNQPNWSFNPKEMAIEIESLVPLNLQVEVPPMSMDSDKKKFTFTLTITLERKAANGQWTAYTLPPADRTTKERVPPSYTTDKKRFPPALWKADATDRMDGKMTLRGGAFKLPANPPSYTRAQLSKDGAAPVKLTPCAAFQTGQAWTSRSLAERTTDRTVYDRLLAGTDGRKAAAPFLDEMARLLQDPELQPKRWAGRSSSTALLDPPLLNPPLLPANLT